MPHVSSRLGCLAFGLFSVTLLAAEPSPDQKKLAGTWKPVEAKLGDIVIDQEVLAKITLVKESDRFTLTSGDDMHAGTFVIDAQQSPKTIDLFYTQGPNNGQTTVGIYEVDGDTLTACYSLNPNMRPTELSSAGDQTRVLVKFRREKQ